MKIKSTISYSSFLMIVLIFSQPVIILAQQDSVGVQAKINAERDATTDVNKLLWAGLAQQDSVEVQAKIDAERDATTDVNKLLWAGVGCAGIFFGLLGCYAGVHAASSSSSNDLGSAIGGAIIAGGVGSLVGSSVPNFLINNYRLSPLPERLIGKSSVYVDFYTDTYKTKTQRLRRKSAAIGALVSAGCMIILLRVLDK